MMLNIAIEGLVAMTMETWSASIKRPSLELVTQCESTTIADLTNWKRARCVSECAVMGWLMDDG